MRGEIFDKGFEPQFSGHETFPLRYSWLKKVHDAVDQNPDRTVFSGEDAISRFGVGKNMVSSMRYWALAAGMIEELNKSGKGSYQNTPLGTAIFAEDEGWDPYIEDPATLWLIHWQFATRPRPTTTIHYVFNHFHAASFYRQQLTDEIIRFTDTIGHRIAPATLKRDVDCFLRTYTVRAVGSEEDSLDSLMAELALIRPVSKVDGFVLSRGAKPSLHDAIFYYALVDFAQRKLGTKTFSIESLLHEPCSPGRVFLLDEEALIERLNAVERISDDRIAWSETAGLRQIIFQEDPTKIDLLKAANRAYSRRKGSVAA